MDYSGPGSLVICLKPQVMATLKGCQGSGGDWTSSVREEEGSQEASNTPNTKSTEKHEAHVVAHSLLDELLAKCKPFLHFVQN